MEILEHASLKRFNTFGVEARARAIVRLASPEDAWRFLEQPEFRDLPRMILGQGSNVLFRRDFPGVILQPVFDGVKRLEGDATHHRFRARAGHAWHALVRETVSQGIAGLENLSLIPGSVGAAPIQNIGAYGVELAAVFESLSALDLDRGEWRHFDREAACFGYRDSLFKSCPDRYLICHVTLRLPRQPVWHLDYGGLREALAGIPETALTPEQISDAVCRIRRQKLPDPAVTGNAGSFFKNPVVSADQAGALQARWPDLPAFPQSDGWVKLSAAWLIEQTGWKGHRRAGVGVSSRHALVLVNHGGGSGEALWRLAGDIQASVRERFGVELQPEPRIV